MRTRNQCRTPATHTCTSDFAQIRGKRYIQHALMAVLITHLSLHVRRRRSVPVLSQSVKVWATCPMTSPGRGGGDRHRAVLDPQG
jgi:hypothetical protein